MQILSKFDRFLYGFLAGLVVPVIISGLVILVQLYNQDLTDDWKQFIYRILPKIIGVASMANLGVFYFFLNKKLHKAAKGVIISVVIFTIPLLLD